MQPSGMENQVEKPNNIQDQSVKIQLKLVN